MRARKKKHLPERMENASDYLIAIPEEETTLSFSDIFNNSNPIHLSSRPLNGSAKGLPHRAVRANSLVREI